MARIPLKGMTLNLLSDGLSGLVLNDAITAVGKDLFDRGHDGKQREIVITVKFKPVENGRIAITCVIKPKLPAMQPPVTIAKLENDGVISFNPELASNPEQSTFADLKPAGGGRMADDELDNADDSN